MTFFNLNTKVEKIYNHRSSGSWFLEFCVLSLWFQFLGSGSWVLEHLTSGFQALGPGSWVSGSGSWFLVLGFLDPRFRILILDYAYSVRSQEKTQHKACVLVFVWKTKNVCMILDLQQLGNLQPFRNAFRGERVSLVLLLQTITEKLKVRRLFTILLRTVIKKIINKIIM